jgi:hypothetical protein
MIRSDLLHIRRFCRALKQVFVMSIYFKTLSALAIIVVLSAVSAKAQTAPQQAQRSNQTVVNSDVNANSFPDFFEG